MLFYPDYGSLSDQISVQSGTWPLCKWIFFKPADVSYDIQILNSLTMVTFFWFHIFQETRSHSRKCPEFREIRKFYTTDCDSKRAFNPWRVKRCPVIPFAGIKSPTDVLIFQKL